MEVLFEFVEPGGEPSKLLEVGEGYFDTMALSVEVVVEASLQQARAAGRDHSLDAAFGEPVEDRIGDVALVCERGFRAAVAEQRQGLGAVVDLVVRQDEAGR